MNKIYFLALILIFSNCKNSKTQKMIKIGDKVPYFSLKTQDNVVFNVKDYIGKPMVIYFYPKDNTSGCTKEACKFRDEFDNFKNVNTLIIGISSDSVESHKKFAKKYNLPFILLADTNKKVRKMFTGSNFSLIPKRITFVIDSKGIIQYIFDSQFKAEKHIENSLKQLKKIQ